MMDGWCNKHRTYQKASQITLKVAQYLLIGSGVLEQVDGMGVGSAQFLGGGDHVAEPLRLSRLLAHAVDHLAEAILHQPV